MPKPGFRSFTIRESIYLDAMEEVLFKRNDSTNLNGTASTHYVGILCCLISMSFDDDNNPTTVLRRSLGLA